MMLSSVDDINRFGRKFHGELKVVVSELSSTRWFQDAILHGDWRKIKEQSHEVTREDATESCLLDNIPGTQISSGSHVKKSCMPRRVTRPSRARGCITEFLPDAICRQGLPIIGCNPRVDIVDMLSPCTPGTPRKMQR